ncbi:hypothetical protein [Flavobacterium sp. U410]
MRALFAFFSLSFCFLASCQKEKSVVDTVFSFPKELKELSGIIEIHKELYLIQDSRNKPEILVFDSKGKLQRTIKVLNIENTDWEALTKDEEGNIYIGDFGNNDNDRSDLRIIKINRGDLQQEEVKPSQIISFHYSNQKKFPPKKKDKRNFNVEAFVESENFFYLFSKNSNGIALVYQIPNQQGEQVAVPIDSLELSVENKPVMITDAAFDSQTHTLVLLGHSTVFQFQVSQFQDLSKTTKKTVKLHHNSQKEGICFKDAKTLWLVDERDKKIGGNLYQLLLD